eukprot:4536369-Prorocentrum_lima.AAC.1
MKGSTWFTIKATHARLQSSKLGSLIDNKIQDAFMSYPEEQFAMRDTGSSDFLLPLCHPPRHAT